MRFSLDDYAFLFESYPSNRESFWHLSSQWWPLPFMRDSSISFVLVSDWCISLHHLIRTNIFSHHGNIITFLLLLLSLFRIFCKPNNRQKTLFKMRPFCMLAGLILLWIQSATSYQAVSTIHHPSLPVTLLDHHHFGEHYYCHHSNVSFSSLNNYFHYSGSSTVSICFSRTKKRL